MSTKTPSGGDGDVTVIIIAVIGIAFIATTLAVLGIFYHPSWALLSCLIGHLAGTNGVNCI